MLGCFDTNDDLRRAIGLVLVPCSSPLDPTRQLYHTGLVGRGSRTILLEKILASSHIYGRRMSPRWRDIHIAGRPLFAPQSLRTRSIPSDYTLSPPFRFPQHFMACFGKHCSSVIVSSKRFNWTGSPPVVFEFHLPSRRMKIYMVFGVCSPSGSHGLPSRTRTDTPQPGGHWAFVFFDSDREDHSRQPHHVCSRDHIANWYGRSHSFTNGDSPAFASGDHVVTLSFVQDALSPIVTLVPQVKYVYKGRSPVHVRITSPHQCTTVTNAQSTECPSAKSKCGFRTHNFNVGRQGPDAGKCAIWVGATSPFVRSACAMATAILDFWWCSTPPGELTLLAAKSSASTFLSLNESKIPFRSLNAADESCVFPAQKRQISSTCRRYPSRIVDSLSSLSSPSEIPLLQLTRARGGCGKASLMCFEIIKTI